MASRQFCVCLFLLITINLRAGATEIEDRAQAVLVKNCGECHGAKSKKQGGIDYIDDLTKIVSNNLVVPGDPSKSLLFERLTETDESIRMPLNKAKLSEADLETISRWISGLSAGGAPVFEKVTPWLLEVANQPVYRDKASYRYKKEDLETIAYFVIPPRHRRPELADEYRNAISYLMNSLSWKGETILPEYLDSAGSVLKVDIAEYGIDLKIWRELERLNPHPSASKILRADWFLATASKPPFYHTLLNLPQDERELLGRLNVNIAELSERTSEAFPDVARAGFMNSGVSFFNRMIERFDGGFGFYWRSHDFGSKVRKKLLRQNPLPITAAVKTGQDVLSNYHFEENGGESIFTLPNGLHGYLLVDERGRRINEGPAHVVYDREKTRIVTNGVSCMACHASGVLPKNDEIRAYVAATSSFPSIIKDEVRRTYIEQGRLNTYFEKDKDLFQKAAEATKLVSQASAVSLPSLVDIYEADLSPEQVATECAFNSVEELFHYLESLDVETRKKVAPLLRGEYLERETFEDIAATCRNPDSYKYVEGTFDYKQGTRVQKFDRLNLPLTYKGSTIIKLKVRSEDSERLKMGRFTVAFDREIYVDNIPVRLTSPDGIPFSATLSRRDIIGKKVFGSAYFEMARGKTAQLEGEWQIMIPEIKDRVSDRVGVAVTKMKLDYVHFKNET